MKRFLFVACIIILAQLSCSRKSETIGPDICPSASFTYGAFEFKDNGGSTSSLDLSNSYAKVVQTFNEEINYKVVISAPSGAEYLYNGKGNQVNLNWYGNSTNGKPFKQGDVLSAKVTNSCYTEPLGAGSLVLNTIISYNSGFGLKLINFEDAVGTSTYGSSVIVTKDVGDSGYEVSPQGGKYLNVKGSSGTPVWYFGGVGFTPLPDFSTLGTNPDDVYLNYYVKGQANSQCQMVVKEQVKTYSLNRRHIANATPGWMLHSVKLRDIGIIDPSKITGVELNLGATTQPDVSCEFDIDLILFTFGKPL